MTKAFLEVCADVDRATQTIFHVEDCRPHYQRVLDYIVTHPEERDEIAHILSRHVRRGYVPGGIRSDMSLVQFLMETLKWPEVRAAAEEMFKIGDGQEWAKYKRLLDIYEDK
jgi:hypothetical protein